MGYFLMAFWFRNFESQILCNLNFLLTKEVHYVINLKIYILRC